VHISADLLDIVKTEYPASPPLRDSHFRDTKIHISNSGHFVKPRPDIDWQDRTLCRVLQLLRMLCHKGLRDLFSLHVILDELERLMQAELRAKALITPHLASTLSQLSIMSECLHQLHQFQPWARKIESVVEEQFARYFIGYDTLFRNWGAINTIYEKFSTLQMFEVGNPKDGKFHYPADKRRTRETVNAMIAAEAALDDFWRTTKAYYRRYIETTPFALIKHIMGDRTIQRTPPWTEPPKTAIPSIAHRESSAMFTLFGSNAHNISSQITGNFKKLAVSDKPKKETRGIKINNGEHTAAIDTDEAIAPMASTIPVGKRAIKVFNSLVQSPNSPGQPGEVAWPDFLHAMVKAGFGAEKLQGSAWHFTPQNMDVERSIQFHEPHPSNKLPFTWARCYGRRLTRAFGWTRDSFTLA
jgi:hypothetical protein